MTGRVEGITVTDRRGRPVATVTWAGVLGRLGIVVPVVVVLVAAARLAPDAPWWPPVLLMLLAVATAVAPDSGAGLLTIVGTGAWWAVAAADAPLAWSLLPSVALLGCHLATAFAAAGAPNRSPDAAAVVRIARSATPVVGATVALWLVAVAVEGRVVVPPAVLAGTLLAVAALPLVALRR